MTSPLLPINMADIQGLGAIRAIKDAGLKIPDHIKVISLTGHSVGKMLETSMTSMEMPSRDIGHKTARMIIEQIESNNPISPEHLMFSYNLVEREST